MTEKSDKQRKYYRIRKKFHNLINTGNYESALDYAIPYCRKNNWPSIENEMEGLKHILNGAPCRLKSLVGKLN